MSLTGKTPALSTAAPSPMAIRPIVSSVRTHVIIISKNQSLI
jgi:hypothetical protein